MTKRAVREPGSGDFMKVLVPGFLFLWYSVSLAQIAPEPEETLRNRIEAGEFGVGVIVGDEVLYAATALPLFYERRGYAPAWIGPESEFIDQLIWVLRRAEREGLRGTDYHLGQLVELNDRVRFDANPGLLIDMELLATDAFLTYGSHLLSGIVNPETIDPEWFANRRGADMATILQNTLDAGSIEEPIAQLLPRQSGYHRLRDALQQYREIRDAGGWKAVAHGGKLESGGSGERVRAVRNRLMLTGDLVNHVDDTTALYDEVLTEAVKRFQIRHGLDVDGVVGPSTLASMNVPVEQRIRQIIINLERWRWLPQELGSRYILVNIASFELDVVEGTETVLTMRVVVGKNFRRTPVFSDHMTYLVINPSWHVPPGIAVRDKLPEIKKDPGYLARQGMHLLQGWGAETVEVDPASVDWSVITAKNFPYRLKQNPGPMNALGQIKFMFPNKFNIYLHDTPTREHFNLTSRAFSSGCIRIQRPIDLAAYLLSEDPKWTREKIMSTLGQGNEETVRLRKPVPVHLLYWTAWAEENGGIHFRNDVYGRDKPLYEAMRETPPQPDDGS